MYGMVMYDMVCYGGACMYVMYVMHACMYVCMYAFMSVFMYVCMCVCGFVCGVCMNACDVMHVFM